MDAKELMKYDWVMNDRIGVCQVIGLPREVKDYPIEITVMYPAEGFMEIRNIGEHYIQPVELTPEILEKNYGKETQVGISDKPCWGEMGAIWSTMLWKCENSFWLEVSTIAGGFVKKHILYVHELQHALRLSGKTLPTAPTAFAWLTDRYCDKETFLKINRNKQ